MEFVTYTGDFLKKYWQCVGVDQFGLHLKI